MCLGVNKMYYKGYHYIVKVNDKFAKKYKCWNGKQIDKILKNQKSSENVYISKYPQNKKIDTIILDFDSKNKIEAYYEVVKLKNYLKYKNINSVIVDSSNKGYHIYIEIYLTDFNLNLAHNQNERTINDIFNLFVLNIINNDLFKFNTLDMVNTNAGLRANIRLIGSIHPKTKKRVKIIDGEFKTERSRECRWHTKKVFNETLIYWKLLQKQTEEKIQNYNKNNNTEVDIIANNDLRNLIPQIFGLKVSSFGDYVTAKCPFHNDSNPSLLIKKEWYYCWGCGEKGNIWTLIKKGIIKYGDVS